MWKKKKSVAHCFSLIEFGVFKRRIKKVKKTSKSRVKRTKGRKEKIKIRKDQEAKKILEDIKEIK